MPGPALRAMLTALALGVAAPGLAQPGVDQVAIEARFAAVSRTAAQDLGIDWFLPSDGIQTDVIGSGVGAPLSTPQANFNLIIDALEADLRSRVVADPRIATGADGVFAVDLTSPVPLPTVNYGEVGVELTVTPTVVANGVQLQVDLKSGGLAVPPGGTVPIVDIRQLDTSVLLPTGSTLAIGGLFPDDMGETAAKVPFLADIPVIGSMFASRNYQDGRTKPLMFVFPYTVGAADGADIEDEDGRPVAPVEQVMLQARIVEAAQSTFQDLGIDWQGGGIGTTVLDLGNIAPGAADGQASFQTFIEAIEANGLSRTLAAPNLVSLGDGASGLAITSPAGFPTIDFNQLGVTLNFTPVVVDNDEMRLQIEGGSGGLTFPSGGNIPALETRQLETSVSVRDGETVVIGGLFPDDMAAAGDRLPFLADIPLLGSLFRSTGAGNDQTELVIIVTPYLTGGARGSSSSGTAAAVPAQPPSTTQSATSTAEQTTSAVATETAAAPVRTGQRRRLTGSLAGVASRIDLNSQFGGGVVIFPDDELFASQSPDSIRMNGFALSIDLDLGQPHLFGLPDVVSRLLASGQPTAKLFASFSHASGDAQDHFRDSNTSLDYGIVFAEEFYGSKGLSFDGAVGAGLDGTTRTETTWYRAAAGVTTEYPTIFGNPRLTLEKDHGVFLEKLETDYDADTVVLFNDNPFPGLGSQTTTATTEDRYLGVMFGHTLYYALTERLRVGIGGELSLSHRSSSAEVHQHNVSSLDPPLDDFDLNFDYDDSGLAVGYGAALLGEYALTDRLRLSLAYRRQTLPGVTTLILPETTSQIPVGAEQERATRRSVSFAVSYGF